MNTQTGQEVAVKIETVCTPMPQLKYEAELLRCLRAAAAPPQGIPECFFVGREGGYTCMVMELLGKSLEDQLTRADGRFSAKATASIAQQVLQRVEYVHSKGIVHQDIKPDNFMTGIGCKAHHIYLIDFGLGTRYWDKSHLPLRQTNALTGTLRYASINAHKGYSQSRRDDLEAVGHMLFYMLRGKLPWSGIQAKTKREKYRKILETKESYPLSRLCEGYPTAFEKFLSYSRKLGFSQRPDYDLLYSYFESVDDQDNREAQRHLPWLNEDSGGGVGPDWVPEPVHKRVALRQPDDHEGQHLRRLLPKFSCICGNAVTSKMVQAHRL